MTSNVHSRPRVLVADDHPEMVRAICRLLALDCEVVGTVSDGADVLGAVQRLRPEVIVIDLNLPTISGLEVCRQVRHVTPETKVIVFTAANDPYLKQRAFELGASAFVGKVASDDDLLSAINRVCHAGLPLPPLPSDL